MVDAAKDTNQWKTAITEVKPNRVAVRGYDIADLMGRVSFGQAVYLILRGEMPSEAVGRVMEAIVVSSIDHGATPPSCLAARTVASTGGTLSASVAAGIMSINEHHGGAIENCARTLAEVVKRAENPATAKSLESVATVVIDETAKAGKRVAGFGHRYHTADPRAARLFALAEEAGVRGPFIDAARAMERVFAARGKPLPINVDGAIGAVLAQLGFDPGVMNGLFMIARAAGLVAHVMEEKTREKPMRKIDPQGQEYDGPPARHI